MVASRFDTYLAGSLFDVFRLQRVSLNEVKGCGKLAAFLKNVLILHGIVAQPVDTALFIWI